ncbi:MAG: T9SS type A sorting domain-containing protein [Bacteroidales bacterium]|nr:T9SS type A sorting domain-containing protein [Bacteroidales bacterium]
MKIAKLSLLLTAILFFITGEAATIKVLFDNTKAEQAGNADWVIDGNTQLPSPAQSGITSSTAETYWGGALSAWGVDCAKKGYTVETLPTTGKITYGLSSNNQDLSKYNVFIICEPNSPFSETEKTAILNFVKNGGGLFMVSDHDVSDRNNDGWDSPHIWIDFLTSNSVQINPFGISFDLANISGTSTNIASLPKDSILHGPMGNVAEVAWFNGTTMTINKSINPSVVAQIFKSGSSTTGTSNVLFATARYGKGKVAAIGDSSPCDDGTGASGNNLFPGYFGDANGNHQLLLMNATIWLATPSLSTGIEQMNADYLDLQIHSNPLINKTLNICYSLSTSNEAKLDIIDATGKIVKTNKLVDGITEKHNTQIDVSSLKSGIYFCTLSSSLTRISKTFILKN